MGSAGKCLRVVHVAVVRRFTARVPRIRHDRVSLWRIRTVCRTQVRLTTRDPNEQLTLKGARFPVVLLNMGKEAFHNTKRVTPNVLHQTCYAKRVTPNVLHQTCYTKRVTPLIWDTLLSAYRVVYLSGSGFALAGHLGDVSDYRFPGEHLQRRGLRWWKDGECTTLRYLPADPKERRRAMASTRLGLMRLE